MITKPVSGQTGWDVPLNAALDALQAGQNSLQSQVTGNLDNVVYNVINHGTVGDGTTDNASALNSLISTIAASSAHGTIYFPRGTYLINSPLTPTVAMRFTGEYGAIIKSSAGHVFDFAGNYMHPGFGGQTGVIEIDHLILDATGGHVFNAASINQGRFHDLVLYQRSSGYSIWSSTGTLLWINFENIISTVFGSTRSVPAWSIQGSSTADVANLTWSHCLFQNNDSDATQYQVFLTATNASSGRWYHEQNAFRDCYFEKPFGGAIKSLSGQGTIIDGCRVYDVFTGATVGNSLFYIGQDPNSTWPSTNTCVSSCGRDLQGPNGSSTWDVYLESSCLQTEISQYDVRDIPGTFTGHPFLNLNNAAGVVLSNNRSQTLTNANGAGLWNFTTDGSLSGANGPLSFQPISNDSGYQGWSFDPSQISGTGIAPANGSIVLVKVLVPQPVTVTNVLLYIVATGSGLTTGQNFAGLYNSAGTLIASTADQTTAWGSTGWKQMALSGGPYLLSPGYYWVAFMCNATTRPSFGKNNNALDATVYNGTLSAARARYATNGTGTTALSSTITPSSNTTLNVPYWAALT